MRDAVYRTFVLPVVEWWPWVAAANVGHWTFTLTRLWLGH